MGELGEGIAVMHLHVHQVSEQGNRRIVKCEICHILKIDYFVFDRKGRGGGREGGGCKRIEEQTHWCPS